MTIRHAAVAGSFYPAEPLVLKKTVLSFLDKASSRAIHPKALIVPHAGYIYSGASAAHAYKLLMPLGEQIKNVILLGPSHRVAFSGIATPACEEFETPLGKIPVDTDSIREIQQFPDVIDSFYAHQYEHSLEVQLPFLQQVLGRFTLTPLVVGDTNAESVAQVLEHLWGGEETLIVVSTDLSHYHPYQCAKVIDAATSHEIEQLHPVLGGEQACGCKPLNGLLLAAKRHQLSPFVLDLRNSGDTAGDKAQVVGYGAYALQ